MSDTTESLRAVMPETLKAFAQEQFSRGLLSIDDVRRVDAYALRWAADRTMLDGAGKTNDELWKRLKAAERWKVACKNLMVAVGMDPTQVAAAETPEEARPPEWSE